MNPPSEDIKDMLTQSNGIGTFGSNVFIGLEPLNPDECVTIYDTGGFPVDLAIDLYYPTVQVRIRGASGGYKVAYNKATTILGLLHGVHAESWNGTKYILVQALSDILSLGTDENNRPLLTINFRIIRT